jgi:hypothetical protein
MSMTEKDRPIMNRVRNLGWGLVGLVLLWGGIVACEPPPAKLDLQLYYTPGQAGVDVYSKITVFKVFVRGSGIPNADDERTEFLPESSGLVLPKVKCDKEAKGNVQLDVEVVGFSDSDASRPVHSGRQVLYRKCGVAAVVPLFVSPINQFSQLTEFVGADGEISRFAQSDERMAGQRSILLPDGRVLMTGGAQMTAAGKLSATNNSTYIFDPLTGTFETGPDMSTPRAFHTITSFDNGQRIAIVGGVTNAGSGEALEAVSAVDIFTFKDDGTLERGDTLQLKEARAFHTATLTPTNGNLLIYGGVKWEPDADNGVTTVQRWEIISLGSSPAHAGEGALTGVQQRAMHTASLTSQGQLVVIGGFQLVGKEIATVASLLEVRFKNDDTEIEVSTKSDVLKTSRVGHTATVLADDGGILVVGGMEPDKTNPFLPSKTIKSIELLNASGTVVDTFSANLQEGRVFHTVNQLADKRVLVYGGLTSATSLAGKAELYLPDQAGVKTQPVTVPHLRSRLHHSAVVLLNGALFVFGGVTLEETGKPNYATLNKGSLFNPGPVRTN